MTDHQPLSDCEQHIRTALAAGELERAAVVTLRAYSEELLGYLIGSLRDLEQAREVFSLFAEDLWLALPKLALRTSMRAYCYALARNASHRYLDRDLRRQRRAVPLSSALASQLAAHTRTATANFLRSEHKGRIAALRDRLSQEEQELLLLRVHRKLEWGEVVEALGESEGEGDQARALARVRKRFQLTKQKLARWAREEGIVASDDA